MPTLEKSRVKKILLISLSNIGDVILNFPVIDVLKSQFPDAQLSVLIGPKGQGLFKGNPHIAKLYIYNKYQSVPDHIRLWSIFRQERFDLVVDLRNTVYPYFIGAGLTTGPFIPKTNGHLRDKHLARLKTVVDFSSRPKERYALVLDKEDEVLVERIFREQIGGAPFCILAPGSADENKRWNAEGFGDVGERLADRYHFKVVFVGNQAEAPLIEAALRKMKHPGVNLCAKVNLTQLAGLLKKASLAIGNDSGFMHLASYLDCPGITLFGPTDPKEAGYWGSRGSSVKKCVECPRCRNRKLPLPHVCIQAITPDDVWAAIERLGICQNSTRIS